MTYKYTDSLIDSYAADIYALKEENDHTGAMAEAAKLLGLTELEAAFDANAIKHARIGYLREDIYNERAELYETLKKELKENLSEEHYAKIYGAM